MIIKCVQMFNENTKKFRVGKTCGFYTIGYHYHVLEIDFSKHGVYYRIVTDDAGIYGHPVLARVRDFEVISGRMPANWVLKRFEFSTATLGPEKWVNHEYWEEDFWSDWSAGKPKALDCFDEELKIIQETDREYMEVIRKEREA